jgi:hypothetical protein
MSHCSSLLAVLGRSLAARLDRLRDILDGLRHTLRETVLRSVGETVGAAVREALAAVLAHGTPEEEMFHSDFSPHAHDPPWWDGPAEPPPSHDEWEWLDTPPDHDCAPSTGAPAPGPESRRTTVTSLLLLGCQAAAWWLRRQRQHFPTLAALGIGTACGLATYLGAPVLIAGLGLAGSVLSLVALAGAARAGAAALGRAISE